MYKFVRVLATALRARVCVCDRIVTTGREGNLCCAKTGKTHSECSLSLVFGLKSSNVIIYGPNVSKRAPFVCYAMCM